MKMMRSAIYDLVKMMLAIVLAIFSAAGAISFAPIKAAIAQTEPAAKNFEKELLGPYTSINALTASNIRHAYITFMNNVRAKHENWTDQDWELAKAVKQKLDARRNSMDRILSVTDRSEIKILQAEFRALATKEDLKD